MYITKVKVSNGTNAEEITVNSNMTLRQVFDEANVSYARGILQYNGDILGNSALDSTIEELTDDPNKVQVLNMAVKSENAHDDSECDCEECCCEAPAEATAVINGAALVIASTATPDEIKTIKKYRPSALKLMEGDGAAKKQIFMVDIDDGYGDISQYGAVFSSRVDKHGKATITITIPTDVTDPVEWAQEKLGVSILHLRKTEAQFAGMLEDVKNEKAAVKAAIRLA